MREDEDQDVSLQGSVGDVRDGNDVGGQGSARQVLDVLVLSVDDLGQLAAVDFLLEHPHLDLGGEPLGEPGRVGADKPSDQ